MKIACIGDVHCFNYSDFSKIYMVKWDEDIFRYVVIEEDHLDESCKPMNSRLFNVLDGLCDVRDYCQDNEIHHLLVAGDLFHKRETIEVTVYNAAYKVLSSFEEAFGVKLHIIAGNHDDVDNSQIPLTSIHTLNKIAEDVIEKPEKIVLTEYRDYGWDDEFDAVEIVAIPYSKDKKFVLNSMKELREKCKNPRESILLCHLGITGGEVGSGQYSMKDEYSLKELMYDKWKYLIAGHYHRPQVLEFNSIYTGSPLQNNFGDEIKGGGYNGFWVIDTNRRWDMRFIPIIAPRFMTVSPEDIKSLPQEVLKMDYIRVKASAKESELVKDDLESVLEQSGLDDLNIRLELEKEYTTEQRSDIGISNSFEETVEIYAEEKYDGKLDISKVTEMGMSILSEVTSSNS